MSTASSFGDNSIGCTLYYLPPTVITVCLRTNFFKESRCNLTLLGSVMFDLLNSWLAFLALLEDEENLIVHFVPAHRKSFMLFLSVLWLVGYRKED